MCRVDKITLLLINNHRYPQNPALPITFTKHQIVSLLRWSVKPNQSQKQLQAEIQEALIELQARGKVYVGRRNRYCIAPPTLLALEQDNLTGLQFRDDRAYLSLAHHLLKTKQDRDKGMDFLEAVT